MSVVNSMLRNLDERELASAQIVPLREGLPEEVRATNDRPPRLRPSVLIATVALSAALAGALYFYKPKPARLPVPVTASLAEVVATALPDNSKHSVLASDEVSGLVDSQPMMLPEKSVNAGRSEDLSLASPNVTTGKPMRPAAVGDFEIANTKSVTASEPNLALAVSLAPSLTSARPLVATQDRKAFVQTDPVAAAAPRVDPVAAPVPVSAGSSKILVEQTAALPAQTEVQRALELQRRGLLVEAEARLRAVLDDDKNMLEARQALIALLARQQRDEDVRKLLQEGVALAPTQPAMVMQYARVLAGRNDWKAAAEVLAPAATALARDAEYRALTGAVLQRLGRFSQSVDAYQAALRIAPGVGAWWVGVGLSLESDGRLAEARDAYQQARLRDTLTPDLAQFVDSKLARLP